MAKFTFQVVIRIIIALSVAYISSYYEITDDFGFTAFRIFLIFMIILLGGYWLKEIVTEAVREEMEESK